MSELIYDVGMHRGEDAHFYLLKGYRVVGVEADPALCEAAAEKLKPFVDAGQLRIENVAIAEKAGRVTFYRSANSAWGTVVRDWSEQNAVRGCPSEPIEVEAITLADLVGRHGGAFYMKIDIEGMDRSALESLAAIAERPRYISIESAFPRNPSLHNVEAELLTLESLGYNRFKVVPQQTVPGQKPPFPASAGEFVPFRFEEGASGLFGEETPGDWLTRKDALDAFRRIARRNWLHVQLHGNMRLAVLYGAIMHRLMGVEPDVGWYDIHARHRSVLEQSVP